MKLRAWWDQVRTHTVSVSLLRRGDTIMLPDGRPAVVLKVELYHRWPNRPGIDAVIVTCEVRDGYPVEQPYPADARVRSWRGRLVA